MSHTCNPSSFAWLFVLFLLPQPAIAQEHWTPASLRSQLLLPAHGFRMTSMNSMEEDLRRAGHRSVPLALGMSAILPGAGQAYNRNWIKAAAALAIEATLITGHVVYRNQGLDEEDRFRQTAHADWNPARYASWINDYADYLEQEHGASITPDRVDTQIGVNFNDPGSWSEADRVAVSHMFADIRRLERQAFHPETGAVFSHQIPDFADQQYYELIGKYFQFAPGWSDYPEWRGEEDFTGAIDPEVSRADGSKVYVSDSFFEYRDDHAHAQDLLRKARRFSLYLIVNHVVAAVDAAISAKLNNDRLSSRMGIAYGQDGRPTPVVSLRWSY